VHFLWNIAISRVQCFNLPPTGVPTVYRLPADSFSLSPSICRGFPDFQIFPSYHWAPSGAFQVWNLRKGGHASEIFGPDSPHECYGRSTPNVKLKFCYLICGIPTTPLKNDGMKVSSNDEIPNWMVESHEIPWFQSPSISYVYQFSDFVGPHLVSQGLSQLKPISSATFEAHEAPLGLPLRYPFNSASSGKMLSSETFLA